jgi:C1A family cysteine protease
LAVGYDDWSRIFLVLNSWSAKCGIELYRWASCDYLTRPDLAADFWAIQAIVTKLYSARGCKM